MYCQLELKKMKKNTLTGFIEDASFNEFQFEQQRRLYQSTIAKSSQLKAITEKAEQLPESRKRKKDDDDDDDDDDDKVDNQNKINDQNKVKADDSKTGDKIKTKCLKKDEEFAQLHIKEPYDYQGRSFLVGPRDIDGVNLYSDEPPTGCKIPDKLAHTYTGHTKAVTATRYFPITAHLVLSSSLDNKVKLWQIYKDRRCVMTYSGHTKGVRDICFNPRGDRFTSSSFDNYIKLWDTETGACVQRFTTGKMAYCVKFKPDTPDLFLAGMIDKKVVCWDCRSGENVQEYDRHLGAINTITFIDDNRKFVTTSDDKTIRVWEWDIPVDVKYIADPSLHSIPAVTSALNNRRLLCQSMDNKIHIFNCNNDRYKLDNKKTFGGHMVAGYACQPDFSCDMSYVVSGDANGKIFFWSWSSGKIIKSIKAHQNACICVNWHPHEKHKLISAGWDNQIKLWE